MRRHNLSRTQDISLSVLSIFSSTLSITGSLLILRYIHGGSNSDLRGGPVVSHYSTYDRLLSCMSCADLLFSLVHASQVFMTPRGTWAWSQGSEVTCNLAGLFQQMTLTNLMYYGCLSYYFLLTIKFNLSRDHMKRRVEPVMHSLAVGWPLVTGVTVASFNVNGPKDLSQWCWVDNYPKGCSGDECSSNLIGWIVGGVPLVMVVVSLPINNFLIYNHIRRHTPKPTNTSVPEEGNIPVSVVSNDFSRDVAHRAPSFHSQRSQVHDDRLKLVASQSILYVGAFFAVYTCASILLILEGMDTRWYSENKEANTQRAFPVMVLHHAFTPLAGLLNAIVFFRPKYIRLRQREQSMSRLMTVLTCLRKDSSIVELQHQQQERRRLAATNYVVAASRSLEISDDSAGRG